MQNRAIAAAPFLVASLVAMAAGPAAQTPARAPDATARSAASTKPPGGAQPPARANYFDDPFIQATGAIAGCPVPDGPAITREEMQVGAHERAERGTRCYDEGRCRLPNSYLYDREIIPRVKKAILASGRFADTSLWLEGQRRWVWLKGCIRRAADKSALDKLVRSIDDVEAVVDELVVLPR